MNDPVARHRRLCELFERLQPLDADARTAALAELDDEDPSLIDELTAMLAASGSAALRIPTAEAAADVAALAADRGYRVLREIGRGGMGRVLLAERADGRFDRQVAIKVLDRSPHDADWRRRFDAERAILARLQHPRIARLLDAGEAADGTPYLVMEYIEGVPLDAWVAQHAPDLDRRIALFEQIAQAVAHAHGALVAHRDLKPGNVLVDANGDPHLLDFGIARLLEQSATVTEERALTPRYAAPEQIAGEPATSAVDIYQLGLLFGELLSGEPPYADLTGAALLQAICTRDPQHRYRSVDALLDDIARWREGQPVFARRGGRLYRGRKFVRRHWLALAAAASIVVLTAGFVWRLQHALARSELEQATAQQVTELMIDVLGNVDPRRARGRELTLREALEQGAERIRAEPELPDAVRGRLLHALGGVFLGLSDFERAGALLEEALPYRERAGTGLDAVNTAYSLAVLRQREGRLEDSEKMVRRAVELLHQAAPDDDQFAAELHNGLAIVSRMQGRDDVAAHEFTVAVGLLRKHGSEFAEDLVPLLRNYASCLDERDDHAEAQRLLAEAVEYAARSYPADDPEQGHLLRVRGINAWYRGDLAAAGELLAQAWALTEKLYPDVHDERVRVGDLLAQYRWATGDVSEARALLEAALRDADRLYPNGHSRLYGVAVRLAGLRLLAGDPAAARALIAAAQRSSNADGVSLSDQRAMALVRAVLACVEQQPEAKEAAATTAAALQNEPRLWPWLRTPWTTVASLCQ
jgi:predicted Ser/Thr protein kinase